MLKIRKTLGYLSAAMAVIWFITRERIAVHKAATFEKQDTEKEFKFGLHRNALKPDKLGLRLYRFQFNKKKL